MASKMPAIGAANRALIIAPANVRGTTPVESLGLGLGLRGIYIYIYIYIYIMCTCACACVCVCVCVYNIYVYNVCVCVYICTKRGRTNQEIRGGRTCECFVGGIADRVSPVAVHVKRD